jgi:hypothetical protein
MLYYRRLSGDRVVSHGHVREVNSTMNPSATEWHNAAAPDAERPSEDFIRAVANLLETDADDMLSELGYTYSEAIVRSAEPVEV